jgi:predicted esterase
MDSPVRRTSVRVAAAMVMAAMLACCAESQPAVAGSKVRLDPATAVTPPPPTPVAGAQCDARYGNSPRPQTQSLDGTLALASLCQNLYGESLGWTDADGTARAACLVTPPGVTAASPRPLLVWLHPSLFPMDSLLVTELPSKIYTANLSDDPAKSGFLMLLVAGRDTQHYYPLPDDTGLGWDNWYRNVDRSSPTLNVDVATIDHFIAAVKARGIVDPKRVFLSGWSNGSAMAELYGLNTPGIAAAAVYSAPDPFRDSTDPCPQPAFGNNRMGLFHIGNQCDIIGICNSSEALLKDLGTRGLARDVSSVRVSTTLQEVQGCDAACVAPADPANIAEANPQGTLNHLRWPLGYTDRMLDYLKAHPLP